MYFRQSQNVNLFLFVLDHLYPKKVCEKKKSQMYFGRKIVIDNDT